MQRTGRRIFLFIAIAVMALMAASFTVMSPQKAHADDGTKALQATTRAAEVTTTVAPTIQDTVTQVKNANGDPAEIISRTAHGVSDVAIQVAPVVPPPWGSYLAIIAIIANIIQGLFHRSNVNTLTGAIRNKDSLLAGRAPPMNGTR